MARIAYYTPQSWLVAGHWACFTQSTEKQAKLSKKQCSKNVAKCLKAVTMIDTIKLVLPFSKRPHWYEKARFQNSFDTDTGLFKAVANPSSANKKKGIYQPRLTYTERPVGRGRNFELAIELSLPKLMFNNNFDELTDTDFEAVVKRLSDTVKTTYGIWLLPLQLRKASIRKIDYSKNIIFTDRTPVANVLSNIRTADISKVYDIQNTDFRNGGHIYHIHTNSLDIAIYDKVADLRQERISPKRSREKDGYIQMNLLDELERQKAVTVTRLEVRLNGLRKIRSELTKVGITHGTTFQEMFSSDTSQKLLMRHWQNIFERIPKGLLDSDTAEHLLINDKKANKDMKMTEALARVGYAYLRDGKDERYVRNLLESLFNPSQYRRFKQKSREPPNPTQLKTLLHITNSLTTMSPVRIEDYTL